MMEKIVEILENNQAVNALIKGNSHIITTNIHDEAYLLASSFKKEPKNYVIVKNNLLEAQLLYQELSFLLKDDCIFFPVDESLRIEALAASPEMLAERINAYYQLSLDKKKILVTCTSGIIRYSPSREMFLSHCIELKVNQVFKMDDVRKKLVDLGYQYIMKVDQPFYFSHRGGIIDIYSINYEHPIRIEFFGDEIESIRFYDMNTQRSIASVDTILLLPANELFYDLDNVEDSIHKLNQIKKANIDQLEETLQDALNDEIAFDFESLRLKDNFNRLYKYYAYITKPISILDYVRDPSIIVSKEDEIRSNYQLYIRENDSYSLEMFESGKSIYPLDTYMTLVNVLEKFENKIYFDTFKTKKTQIEFKTRQIDGFFKKDSDIVKTIKDYLTHSNVLIVLNHQHQLNNLSTLLTENQIPNQFISDQDMLIKGVSLYLGEVDYGMEFVDEKVIVLTVRELIGDISSNKTKFIKYKNAKVIKDFDELHIGDYIVHDAHGIGQYLGIKTLEVKGSMKDYLYITYRGNDTLYIPVEQFRMIRKYTSKEGTIPKINKLGSAEWAKTKQRIRKKVEDMADALIALYAERIAQPGFAFKEDDEMQIQFENEFEYELTLDQQISLDEIKSDMQRAQPMDRLLCGDVGFGKTEVALRAAFKAIESNKQVAFLCPTTILSMQHYETAIQRFSRFPVNIALLNRFVSPKQQKDILVKVKNGLIDILIGTHRILSNDIKFKDIGLLIVDEEQRFGVKHKEKIKEYKKTIDVLTLTATPIPRTLQMSLMGIRGLSTIDTPPKNRFPVQTYVMEKDFKLIKQVIERELARNGQVFYLYNRTEDIIRVANQISQAIPYANVGIGHGKMNKQDLENVMNSFINHEFNVLVCTTIIETGIDIPNANTIIVEDADRFGLAQLYQIKGRVGRSDRHAYAYLLYRVNKQLSEEATKRLKAIKEFTELGSGYKIAMRDLSIRGAGDILGGEQAGFIDSVGFDMYMKILQVAINEKKGIIEVEEEIPITNVSSDGYIPKDYVNSDLEKLYLYQQLSKVNSINQINEVRSELKDIYGSLPKVVSSLIDKREFDILNSEAPIDNVLEKKSQVEITFTKEFSKDVDGVKFWDLVYKVSKKIKISYLNQLITITIPKDDEWIFHANLILRRIDEVTN